MKRKKHTSRLWPRRAYSFKYDPFGRRIYKSSSATTSIYAYDHYDLVEETNSSGAVVARYVHGLQTDEPLAMLRAGATSFYSADGLGSISSLSNSGFCPWQVHNRPLKSVPGAGPLGLDHHYFYNTQTGASIGLGPAAGASSGDLLKGNPVPGAWERNEKPGHNNGDVPDYSCDCVNQKANHPGNPPKYCTYKGNKDTNPLPTCSNCFGWVVSVLQDCRNKAFAGQQ